MKSYPVRLPDALKARGEAFAGSLGISLNALLAVALNDYLNARETPAVASRSLPASAPDLDDGEGLVLPPTPSLVGKRVATSRSGVKGASPLASADRSASVARPAAPKVGRNDPCPCQSGRKFKHCCGGPNAR
jgi:hypothetical protein